MFFPLSSVRERRQNQVFFPLLRTSGQVSRDLLGLSLLYLWFLPSVMIAFCKLREHSERCVITYATNWIQWCQIRAAQHQATDGRGTRTRKMNHVRVSTVSATFSTVEEYRRTIFFPTLSRRESTIVDSLRDSNLRILFYASKSVKQPTCSSSDCILTQSIFTYRCNWSLDEQVSRFVRQNTINITCMMYFIYNIHYI